MNYLCAGYKTFIGDTQHYMKAMVNELRNGQQEANIMQKTSLIPESSHNPYTGVGRNDNCPCDSGKKFKRCHGST
mgnify:FL=1